MASQSGNSAISSPSGGGALQGIGEKFSPDLFTGTGNYAVPIAVPPGRNGLQPQLTLQYSTGNGNSPFGLGWGISVPNISRKTSGGVPIYNDAEDVFLLSGAEDLIAIEKTDAFTRYQPRTEGLFAKILHIKTAESNYWKVMTKDGLVSYYGTPEMVDGDPATVFDPDAPARIFSWRLTRTEDPFGNHIVYEYTRDQQRTGERYWNQIYLDTIKYIDHGDPAAPDYLVTVKFNYEERTDPFSSFRQGFEIRTTRRCTNVENFTHHTPNHLIRRFDLVYLDEPVAAGELSPDSLPLNGVSMLSQVKVTGFKDGLSESMPPLNFGYTIFKPQEHNLIPVTGQDLPPGSLARPEYELADLFGNGLPDILEMAGGVVRYWRNLGEGRFDLPRFMAEVPAGLYLGDPDVHLIDANGDARIDLMVNANGRSGYFSSEFGGKWDRRSFRKYEKAPSFSLQDPEVQLVDLNGDGITDAIRSGSRLECFFQDKDKGWDKTRTIERSPLKNFPNVSFSDPRVRWADMSGDGLQDIVMIYEGNIEYWPSLGHGDFGRRIRMRNCPRLPRRYDPKRLLTGDIDGDGLADIIYVENNRITLWINQSGQAWSDPIVISGTPPLTDYDAVRMTDLLGRGLSGILWSMDKGGAMRHHLYFLDLTQGQKPYLLHETNNNMGAVTRVHYTPSIEFYLADEKRPETRWQTTLPFPVQTVSRVEVIDQISQGKLTTEYHYHHGYWDGGEREFRGFGRVDQHDTEAFERFNTNGLHEDQEFVTVQEQHYTPPLESRTWFHLGPIGNEHGDWQAVEFKQEYWSGDVNVFPPPTDLDNFLRELPRRARRDALRAMRGNTLRTEFYALDGSHRQDRPYTVTEGQFGVLPIYAPPERDDQHIFLPISTGARTTQWERGDDPMTQLSFTADYDEYGQPRSQVAVAVPRGRDYTSFHPNPAEPYLVTFAATTYCDPVDNPDQYMVDRVAATKSYEVLNNGKQDAFSLVADILNGEAAYQLIGHSLTFYDGQAFEGLPHREIGPYGLPARAETLILTDEIIQRAYGSKPAYLETSGSISWPTDFPTDFTTDFPDLAGYHYHTDSEAGFSTGYYSISGRTKFDFQAGHSQPRGLPTATRDPFDNESTIEYDSYQLLPVKATNPQGMVVQGEYDYDVLQAKKVTDPNGNQSEFGFSPLGLLQKTAVMGKPGENKGDTLDDPGVRYEYDFFAFLDRGDPVWVRAIARENHIHDGINDNTIETVEYSDGFGRLIQTRTQTDDVLFGNAAFGDAGLPGDQGQPNANAVGIERAAGDPLNVIVSGWTVYDNKGQVVEQYEPYFDRGWDLKLPTETVMGQKMVNFYDPRGNVIRTLNPDGTEQRVLFGKVPANQLNRPDLYQPTPWETFAYDPNDLASITHPGDTTVPASHHFTPNSNLLDAMGRTIQTINHQVQQTGSNYEDVIMTHRYDIRGNRVEVIDPYSRTAFSHVYDLKPKTGKDDPGANVLRTDHIDGGTKTVVYNGMGLPVEQRDGKGTLVLNSYDNMNRPFKSWARDKDGETVTLRGCNIYGDAAGLSAPVAQNLLGKPYKTYDEAGLMHFPEYDFKGSPLYKVRQVIRDSEILTAFSGSGVQTYRVNWGGAPLATREAQLLETREFRTDMVYDALGRAVQLTYPEDVDGERKIIRPSFNRAGALQKLSLESPALGVQEYISHIAYSAKGQRLLVAYGNGIMTRYAYDPRHFRLLRLRSEKYVQNGWAFEYQSGSVRQDYAYHYDLNGNIIAIEDRTPGGGLSPTPDALARAFAYDPLNRLLSATGRETVTWNHGAPWEDQPRDPSLAAAYTRKYTYDKLGNMQALRQISPAGAHSFTRTFHYASSGNTLAQLEIGSNQFTFQYDENGNQIQEGISRFMEWDHSDRMRAYYNQNGATPSVHAHYLYDSGGQRVKKLVRSDSGKIEVTVYDGLLDFQYIQDASGVIENNTLHIMDQRVRVATLRVGPPLDVADTTPATKYNLEDHLGNASATLDRHGGSISREEYFPFGQTSFGSYARKRYRFVGKELDHESGMYYYGARYYSPWTCRFVSVDPLFADYPFYTPYQYAGNKPVNFIDLDGLEEQAPKNSNTKENQASTSSEAKSEAGKDVGLTTTFEIEVKMLPKPISHTSDETDPNVDITSHKILNRRIQGSYNSKENQNISISDVVYQKPPPPDIELGIEGELNPYSLSGAQHSIKKSYSEEYWAWQERLQFRQAMQRNPVYIFSKGFWGGLGVAIPSMGTASFLTSTLTTYSAQIYTGGLESVDLVDLGSDAVLLSAELTAKKIGMGTVSKFVLDIGSGFAKTQFDYTVKGGFKSSFTGEKPYGESMSKLGLEILSKYMGVQATNYTVVGGNSDKPGITYSYSTATHTVFITIKLK